MRRRYSTGVGNLVEHRFQYTNLHEHVTSLTMEYKKGDEKLNMRVWRAGGSREGEAGKIPYTISLCHRPILFGFPEQQRGDERNM